MAIETRQYLAGNGNRYGFLNVDGIISAFGALTKKRFLTRDRDGQYRVDKVGQASEFIYALHNCPEFENDAYFIGGVVSSVVFYCRNQSPLLIKDDQEFFSLKNATKMLNLHFKNLKDFSLDRLVYDMFLQRAEIEAKKSPEEREIFILPARKDFYISCNDNFDVLRFLAEDSELARQHLDKTKNKNIFFSLINKDYVDDQEIPFREQLWMEGLGDVNDVCKKFGQGAVLSGAFVIDDGLLYDSYRFFLVKHRLL